MNMYEIDNVLCVIYYSPEALGTVGVISGKSAKIIKKGLLFILYTTGRRGWLVYIPNSVRALYDVKKKEKTID